MDRAQRDATFRLFFGRELEEAVESDTMIGVCLVKVHDVGDGVIAAVLTTAMPSDFTEREKSNLLVIASEAVEEGGEDSVARMRMARH